VETNEGGPEGRGSTMILSFGPLVAGGGQAEYVITSHQVQVGIRAAPISVAILDLDAHDLGSDDDLDRSSSRPGDARDANRFVLDRPEKEIVDFEDLLEWAAFDQDDRIIGRLGIDFDSQQSVQSLDDDPSDAIWQRNHSLSPCAGVTILYNNVVPSTMNRAWFYDGWFSRALERDLVKTRDRFDFFGLKSGQLTRMTCNR